MGRIILASLLSGIILFVWGMLSWMVLPIHDGTVRPLPDAQAVIDVLKKQNLEDGYYLYPAFPDGSSGPGPEMEAAMQEFEKKHQAGPIFSVIYKSQGMPSMPPEMMIAGLLINMLSSFIAATLLSMAVKNGAMFTYFQRFRFVALIGVFAAIVSFLNLKNWMYFPTDFTRAMMLDLLLTWIIGGLVIAALIKPAKPILETKESSQPES